MSCRAGKQRAERHAAHRRGCGVKPEVRPGSLAPRVLAVDAGARSMCRAGPRLRMYRTWVLHDGCTGTYARVARARSVIATSSSACNISLFPSHFGPPATSVFFPLISDRLGGGHIEHVPVFKSKYSELLMHAVSVKQDPNLLVREVSRYAGEVERADEQPPSPLTLDSIKTMLNDLNSRIPDQGYLL